MNFAVSSIQSTKLPEIAIVLLEVSKQNRRFRTKMTKKIIRVLHCSKDPRNDFFADMYVRYEVGWNIIIFEIIHAMKFLSLASMGDVYRTTLIVRVVFRALNSNNYLFTCPEFFVIFKKFLQFSFFKNNQLIVCSKFA